MLKPMKSSDLHNNRRSANLRETNKDEKSFAGFHPARANFWPQFRKTGQKENESIQLKIRWKFEWRRFVDGTKIKKNEENNLRKI